MFVWSCDEILTREYLIMLLSHKMILEREIKDWKLNVFHLDDNMDTSRAKRTSLIAIYSFDIYFFYSWLEKQNGAS